MTIERRCGVRTACLAPYAPTATIVRRGTYYAFQPGNDVREYARQRLRRYRGIASMTLVATEL